VPRRVEHAGDQLGVVRGPAHQIPRADPVVEARVELERPGEERVPDRCVRVGTVPDREVVADARGDGLDRAEPDERERPEEERPAIVGEQAVVHGQPDDQRRCHGGALPDETAGDRRENPDALADDQAPEEAPARLPPPCLLRVHAADSARVSARPRIEDRFPRPSVMGVVNVTPDSFSDGGVHHRTEDAVAAARTMHADGAAIVDVGGESTRPGSEGVSLDEELRRVVPVLEAVAGELPVSIDTAKAEVARRAVELGAELVNDVTALRGDPELAPVVAENGAYLCLMHMQGEPRTMQDDPRYEDVVADVKAFLEQRLAFAVAAGIPEERVCLDPGIGFGKTLEHNLELLRRLGELVALGRPLVIGFSRKRSLGRLLGDPDATTGPLSASIAAAVTAYERGAAILRVHDVKEHVEALTVARAVTP
jgi:dihydropteroate synthase